ncbi:hypothetical protein M3Y95_00913800 [Aphelenchoides besseyi]|nr:hypothetical protein M3Y95_00913800 [Aphelenchoides besseyi]
MFAVSMRSLYVFVLLLVLCLMFCAETSMAEEENFQRVSKAKAKFIRFGRSPKAKFIRFGRSGVPQEPTEQFMNYWPSDMAI